MAHCDIVSLHVKQLGIGLIQSSAESRLPNFIAMATLMEQTAIKQEKNTAASGSAAARISSASSGEGSQAGGGGHLQSTPGLPGQEGSYVGEGDPRFVAAEDLQRVQGYIESCLQAYMPQTQVVATLQHHCKIHPSFTATVWQRLEDQNPEFFKMYYLRLKLKDQIVMFNYLLEQQGTRLSASLSPSNA